LGIKITTMVFWFGPQNQAGYGLSVASQNQWEDEYDAGHASRFSGLLRVEASQARVFQSDLKTDGGVMRMVHMTSSWRLRQVQAEDRQVNATGYIEPFYPNFIVFYVLLHRGILVF
jgi:hypothetical protein